MSNEEIERLVGQTYRELAEKRRLLACLSRKRQVMIESIKKAEMEILRIDAVYREPEDLTYVPTQEERHGLLQLLKTTELRIEELKTALEGMV